MCLSGLAVLLAKSRKARAANPAIQTEMPCPCCLNVGACPKIAVAQENHSYIVRTAGKSRASSMPELSKASCPPLTKHLLIVFICLLTCGRAIREWRERLTGDDGDEPANTSSDAEPAGEVITKAGEEVVKELGFSQTNETKCTPVNLTLKGGHRPGVYLAAYNTVIAYPRCKYDAGRCTYPGELGQALGGKGLGMHDMHVRKLGDRDVSQDGYTAILLHWASLVHGQKDYPVELDCDFEFASHELELTGTGAFVNAGTILTLLPVLLLFVPCYCSSMIVFAFDAISCGALSKRETKVCLAVFILPCFFCRLCGVCGWSALAVVPPGLEPPDEKTPAAYSVPRLDQGWLIRATDQRCIRIGVVVAYAATLASTLYIIHTLKGVAGGTVELAMLWCMAFCQLGLGLAVAWGLRASRHVLLVADGATCPEDLRKSLQAELRMIACILGPRVLLTILVGIGLLCGGLRCGVNAIVHGFIHLQALLYARRTCMFGTLFACEGLLFMMTVTFLLEATIAARVVEAHVGEVKTGVDMTVADPVLLKNTCNDCGKLANEVLPELAKISGPLLWVTALKAAFHFACVVFALSIAAKVPADPSVLLILGLFLACPLLDLLVGPLCLFLPARVSDAFADLLDTLNKLRVKPVKEGCDAEVDRC